jgi:hypothetical protein
MLVKDEIIKKTKLLLKLTQPGDGDEEVAIHLENVAMALSKEFQSLTYKSEDLDIVDSKVTFPDDVGTVISAWIGDTELAPVDFNEFQRLGQGGFAQNIIRIQQKAGAWTATVFGNSGVGTGTLTLIYKSVEDDISAFPDQYRRLIMLGASADYYLWEDFSDLNKESKLRARYKEELNAFREEQLHGQGIKQRRESQFELDWNRSFRNRIIANDQDTG